MKHPVAPAHRSARSASAAEPVRLTVSIAGAACTQTDRLRLCGFAAVQVRAFYWPGLREYTLGGYSTLNRMDTAETRGYAASKEQLLNRLARVEGQVRGVARMVEEDRYCIDVLTQIAAIQAGLEKIALGLVDSHVRVCMRDVGEAAPDPEARIEELMGAVGRLVKR